MKGKLYLIPTFLHELSTVEQLPPFNLEIIKSIKHYLVENERSARRFISSLQLGIDISTLELFLLDKNTPKESIKPFIDMLIKGNNVGVMSEAGCPGIADPGSMAVELAHIYEIEVVPLVGPSSITLALMASGFNGQSFAFHGYLPIQKNDRIIKLKQLESESSKKNQTQIFIETPFRNDSLFSDILNNCHPNTFICVAVDLQSPHQLIKSKTVIQWKQTHIQLNKKPAIYLLNAV
ncbi:MAG: SAM-dependent methyltransferase [Bacteroidota bacterium]|nr:SAM-dependent methyltransferase [Bacteroidota bacterium]